MTLSGCFFCLDDYEPEHMEELVYKVLNCSHFFGFWIFILFILRQSKKSISLSFLFLRFQVC